MARMTKSFHHPVCVLCQSRLRYRVNNVLGENMRLRKLEMNTRGCWQVLSPTWKERSYSDQTRDLFNILPTKLNTLLSPLL